MTDMNNNIPLALSRPKDKSLQAFKDFINGMCDSLGLPPDYEIIPDVKWEDDWRKFWGEELEEPNE